MDTAERTFCGADFKSLCFIKLKPKRIILSGELLLASHLVPLAGMQPSPSSWQAGMSGTSVVVTTRNACVYIKRCVWLGRDGQ